MSHSVTQQTLLRTHLLSLGSEVCTDGGTGLPLSQFLILSKVAHQKRQLKPHMTPGGNGAVERQSKGQVTIGLWRGEPRARLQGCGCKGPEVQGFHESREKARSLDHSVKVEHAGTGSG